MKFSQKDRNIWIKIPCFRIKFPNRIIYFQIIRYYFVLKLEFIEDEILFSQTDKLVK